MTSYRMGSSTKDIFVNPTKRELKELKGNTYGGNIRFIADSNYQKVYAFDGDDLHEDRWEMLKKMMNDKRQIYISPSLFCGSMEGSRVFNWGFNDGYYRNAVLVDWVDNPNQFSFADKYFPVTAWFKKNMDNMIDELRRYGYDY